MKKKINVLVTGSSKGIGKAIAKCLFKTDYNVILTGRDEKKLKEISALMNNAPYYIYDLTIEPEKLIERIDSEIGFIDVLVNNAGEYIWAPVEKAENDAISRLLKLNTEVPYKLIKSVVPKMKEKKWGRIVNIGSISGAVGEANASLYSMTKSALIGLTKALALELAEHGITVNTVNPGWVDTDLTQKACDESDFTQQENIDMIPQRRFIHPDEVAELVKYLISDNAKGLTGQSVNLCAGLSVG